VQPVKVHISNYLRIWPGDLPIEVCDVLRDALTVANPDDPNEPPLVLWGNDAEGYLCIPRGFAIKLRKGLNRFGFEPVWEDHRTLVPAQMQFEIKPITPRTYQALAIKRMLSCEQGIYEAPPGAGKTIAAAFFISEVQQRTLIIVDKINIASQWQTRIHDALGFEAGIIGDGQWDERDITITTRQSLWINRDRLRAEGWFDSWGAVIIDECHAISAPTVRAVMNDFSAWYRIGLSATPDRHQWLTLVSRSIIGEIFCKTTDEELEQAGVLVRPRIVAVKTPFEWRWRYKDERKRRIDPKRQWTAMLKDLKVDSGRNRVFMKIVQGCRGHACLVHTDHKQHAVELAAYALAAGWPDEAVMMLTGAEDNAERQRVIARAAEGDCVILSTIGQEAMDIPRLSRFFLVFPTKNDAMVRQMVGRLKRTHETKTEAPIVYDFYDHHVAPLAQQFAARRGAYDRDKLPLTIVGD
jgi:superfamily II DNA or RNA helicase